jgi:chromosome segregation ATPase
LASICLANAGFADETITSRALEPAALPSNVPEKTMMTYAQALTEAKQLIVQQANRIKADGEKLRVQQQVIAEQGAAMSEKDSRIKDQSTAMDAQAEEIRALAKKLEAAHTSREQAEELLNRHGARINELQDAVAELERRSEQQAAQIADLLRQREEMQSRLPTQEDMDALAAMTALLAKRAASHVTETKSMQPMRLAEAA